MVKRVTLGDVAQVAGVSTATVSMALNGKPGSRIPAATIEKVKSAAQELGYRPNTAARALKTGKTGILGFVSDEVTITRFASPMISGILEFAEQAGLSVMMTETAHKEEQLKNAIESLESRNVDGLIIGLMASREIKLPHTNKPTVVCNGLSPTHPCVFPDDYAAGYDSIRYLAAQGHKHIGLIGRYPSPADSIPPFSINARFRGIDDAASELGIDIIAEFPGTIWEPELGYRGALDILEHLSPTAILAANDRIAFGVYQALQQRQLSIPQDVSVLSFDDEDLASLVRPGLTTLQLPYRQMGRKAAELVANSTSENHREPISPLLLPLKVVERESVGTAR